MRSRIYYSFLFYFSNIFELKIFKPINSLVAKIYSLAIPFILKPLVVHTRHSSRDRIGFNIFLSDLDLSIILSKSDIENHKMILNRILKLKRWLPFLGEIEIYEESEYARLQALIKENNIAYTTVRNFRKILWMQQEAQNAKTKYHRYKARRSATICARKLGFPALDYFSLSPFIPKILRLILPLTTNTKSKIQMNLPPSGIQLDFFQASITADEKPQNFILDAVSALFLSAVCPQIDFGDAEWNLYVEQIRRVNPEIRSLWLSLTEIEWLTLVGVDRGSKTQYPWIEPAILKTRSILKNESYKYSAKAFEVK